MKKILFVTDAWHPQTNGVVTTSEQLKKRLETRGFVVDVIEPSQFHTVPLPFYREIRLALFPNRKMQTLIKESSPDYIHIVTEGPLGITARKICIRNNFNFTTSYHTNFHLYAKMRFNILGKTTLPFLRWFHNGAARIFVSTPSLKEELSQSGFKNIVVCPLGVDTDLFTRNPKTIHHLEKPVFAYFGRVAKEKSPEVFCGLSLPGTKLIIGDGPERKKLEALWPQIQFAGYQKGQELVDWLSVVDVLVFPSKTETFGLVILEALACGIPVAAYPVMGPRDIITNGSDGFLDDDLTNATLRCLTINPEICRETALQYSWDLSAKTFEENLVPA